MKKGEKTGPDQKKGHVRMLPTESLNWHWWWKVHRTWIQLTQACCWQEMTKGARAWWAEDNEPSREGRAEKQHFFCGPPATPPVCWNSIVPCCCVLLPVSTSLLQRAERSLLFSQSLHQLTDPPVAIKFTWVFEEMLQSLNKVLRLKKKHWLHLRYMLFPWWSFHHISRWHMLNPMLQHRLLVLHLQQYLSSLNWHFLPSPFFAFARRRVSDWHQVGDGAT